MSPRRLTTFVVTLFVLAAIVIGPGIRTPNVAQARDISGNTYTSPQFGYSITWDNTWLVIMDESAEDDGLIVTDGATVAVLSGSRTFGTNAMLATKVTGTSFAFSEGSSDFVIVEEQGDAARYQQTATVTMTQGGASIPMTIYIEGRALPETQATVVFAGIAETSRFEVARTTLDALLSTLVIPGAASGDGASAAEAQEQAPALVKGEAGPVYMAGPWRVAIVAAAQGTELPGIGLEEKDGKEWVVVVADVTNWGANNPAFPAGDFFVQMAEADTQHKVASGSTASVGRELGLPEVPAEVEIEYGTTGRVVMVFSVNAERTEPSLVYRKQLFPLDDILIFDVETDELSEPAGPPDLQEATLSSVSADGETLTVQYDGESRSRRIRLLGVESPDTADATVGLLSEYEGETVWIETEPAIEESATPSVYLWIDNDRGDRELLNQMLIEQGAAEPGPLPDDARFAAWLQVTADQAVERSR